MVTFPVVVTAWTAVNTIRSLKSGFFHRDVLTLPPPFGALSSALWVLLITYCNFDCKVSLDSKFHEDRVCSDWHITAAPQMVIRINS